MAKARTAKADRCKPTFACMRVTVAAAKGLESGQTKNTGDMLRVLMNTFSNYINLDSPGELNHTMTLTYDDARYYFNVA